MQRDYPYIRIRHLLLLLLAFPAVVSFVHSQVVLPPDANNPQPPTTLNSPNSNGPTQPAIPSNLLAPNSGNQQNQLPLSLLVGEANLQPVKGIKRLPPLWPYYLVVGILALVVFATLLFLLIRRLRKPKPQPVTPADIQALNELASLKPLIQQAKAREFSYEASEIIRNYIQERFGFQALNKTTREFLDQITTTETGISDKHRDVLKSFLNYCDLAKFAKQILLQEQLAEMYDSASHFIKETRPSIMVTNHKQLEDAQEGGSK